MQFTRPAQNASRPDNYILANLPEGEYAFLSRSLAPVDLPQGFQFAGPRDRMACLYFPVSGVVSVDALTATGESVEVGVSGRESLVGIPSLLGQAEVMHLVVMQMAGQGFRVPTPAAQELLRRHGRFTELVYEQLGLQMLQIGQSALCNRLHEVKSRLARWLLTASDRNNSPHLLLTQEFLSQMLGSRRSTVTVMAGELQREGFIEYSRGKIAILDRGGLERAACECYGVVSTAYRQALQADRS